MLKNKKLSILGDSISTYMGISDDKEANSSLIFNPYFYREPFPLPGTYWQILIDRLGLTLCVNNSYSGGNLSGVSDPYSGVNRAQSLARDNGETPDLIIVFMGINDLGRGIADTVFENDYRLTLATIKKAYPNAAVCCVDLPDRDPFFEARTEIFNQKIAEAVGDLGDSFFIAHLSKSRLRGDFYYMNTLDGLHPDEDGMRIIAEVIEDALVKHFNITD